MTAMNKIILAVLALTLGGSSVRAASVSFGWDPVTLNANGTALADLAGYRIFRSTRSLLGLTTAQALVDASIETTAVSSAAASATLELAAGVTHYLRLAAFNAAGRYSSFNLTDAGADAELSVFEPAAPPSDTTRPGVVILAPAHGQVVSGTTTISVSAADDRGVASVWLSVDGSLVYATTAAAFSLQGSTFLLADGSHTLSATAFDAAGNAGSSSSTFVVRNGDYIPPLIVFPLVPLRGATWAIVTWTTNEPSDSTVLFGTSSAYGLSVSSLALVTSHTMALSALRPETLYRLRVRSRDASGNAATSSELSFLTRPLSPTIRLVAGPGVAAGAAALDDGASASYLGGSVAQVRAETEDGEDAVTEVRLVATAPGGGETFDRVGTMTRAADGLWSGSIDNRAASSGELRYYAEAVDSRGRSVRTPVRALRLAEEVRVSGSGGRFAAPDGAPEGRQAAVVIPGDQGVTEVGFKRLDTAASSLKATRERSIDPTFGGSPASAYDMSIPGRPAYVFTKPVTLTLNYQDADGADVDGDGVGDGDGFVDGTAMPASSLKVFWHDGLEWRLIGGVHDKERKTVTAQVTHFSMYGLFPAAGRVAAEDDDARALEKFLSPARIDGVNDAATFGPTVEEVEVFDLNGRRVFRASRQGASAVSWTGRDTGGRVVESGVYMAKLRLQSGRLVFQRLAVVK